MQPTQPTTPAPSNALTRHAQYEQLKRLFEAAKQYDEAWKKADKAKSAKAPVKRDAAKDFLRKVLSGEIPLRLEAQREDDVRSALRLADDFKIRVVLDGVSNPRGAAEGVANRHIPLVLGPFADGDDTAARRERSANWPKPLLTPEGRWALGTFSSQPRGSRLLRVHAAAAVARGLDPDRVLRAMTRDAADILGIGDKLGVIAPGKQADLAVFAGDPLDPSVPVRLVVSQGKIVYQSEASPVAMVARKKSAKEVAALPAKLPKQYALKTECLCLEDGQLRPGMVLIEGGKVSAIAPSVPVSAGVTAFDLGSAVLTPGLVVGHSQLGFAAAIDDAAEADAGHISAADVYDPQQRQVRDLLGAGFTSAVFAPGSVNVIAGAACGVRLGAPGPVGGDSALKLVLSAGSRGTGRASTEPEDPLAAALGRSRGPARYPGSLAGQVELVEQVLSGKASTSELYLTPRVRQEIDKERSQRVAAVLQRKHVALVEAHTRAEIDAALQLIDRFRLRAVLLFPDEVKPFLGELKRLGVGIVARPLHGNDYDRPAVELAEAAAAGIPVAFGAAAAEEPRLTAALAVNAGMPRDAAWRGLTITAAELAGLPGTVGRLVPDGPADWVVWDGPPLDLRSRPVRVAVAGQSVSAPR